MAVRIRLSRGGSKKRPFYKIVVADQRAPRDGRFIERVGSYNPLLPREHADRLVLVEDRIKHWLSVGSLPTDRVARLLNEKGLYGKPAVNEQTKKSQPRPKTVEKMKQKEEALKAKAEAEAAAKAEEATA
ncbi:MAG: 30S ribosomal protein S16 [Alphaproteobacteria bacterium]